MYENQPFKNLLLRNVENLFTRTVFKLISQNCECARMQYLEHYVCSGIELVLYYGSSNSMLQSVTF